MRQRCQSRGPMLGMIGLLTLLALLTLIAKTVLEWRAGIADRAARPG